MHRHWRACEVLSAKNKMGAPFLRVLCARVGTPDARSAALEVDVDLAVARVERTLLSIVFDVDFDFDFDGTLIRRGCPILARSLRKSGNHGRLQRRS